MVDRRFVKITLNVGKHPIHQPYSLRNVAWSDDARCMANSEETVQ